MKCINLTAKFGLKERLVSPNSQQSKKGSNHVQIRHGKNTTEKVIIFRNDV